MASRSASRSEGECISSDSDSKATRPLSHKRDYDVDRHSRHYTSARNRPRYSRSRSRSPYRASRRDKRRRDDDSQKLRMDARTFSVRYEDSNSTRRNSHGERHSKRSRTYSPSRSRSRSPYRVGRENKNGNRTAASLSQSVSDQNTAGGYSSKQKDAKTADQKSRVVGVNGSVQEYVNLPRSESLAHLQHSQPNEPPPVVDEAALIEARRKRREAIKDKYKGQESSLLAQALHVPNDSANGSVVATPDRSVSPAPASAPISTSTPQTPKSTASAPLSPVEAIIDRDRDITNRDHGSPRDADEPSAADYDPTVDMQEERARHDSRLFKEDETSTEQADRHILELGDAQSKSKVEFDMFADNVVDDMFADSPVTRTKQAERPPQALNVTMMDNWDDAEGYYNTILGELIDGRYQVTQNLGRGMFASVIRATDTKSDAVVAIKVVRNNESMHKAGIKEIDVLKELTASDPDDTKHVVRLHRAFEHKGHLCMVFENLSMNLREVLKKFGRDVGINLKAIRAYAKQLFLGLTLLKRCQILHADLKPDNILINEAKSSVKICDLGSASPIAENAIAPYLVSRFYRAPEIILGIPYDYGIDMWSVGCTLFELYTGKILFTGRNNNNMLKAIMECRGKFPHKLLRRGSLTYDYFDDLLNFRSVEQDKVTGRVVTKMVDIKAKPVRDLRARMMPKDKRVDEQERKGLEAFVDLLDKCLALSPDRRISPSEALKHPFITRTK